MIKDYKAMVKMDGKTLIVDIQQYTKKDATEDLRRNGYKVKFVSTEENFDKDLEKYLYRKELNNNISKCKYKSDKEEAKIYKCSVAVLRKAKKEYFKNNDILMTLKDYIEIYR